MNQRIERLQSSIELENAEERLDGSTFYVLYEIELLGHFARLGVLDENETKKLVIEFRIEVLKIEAELEEKYEKLMNLAILEDWGPRKIQMNKDELFKIYYHDLWLRFVREIGLNIEETSLFVRQEESPFIYYAYIHIEKDGLLEELFGSNVTQFDQTGNLAD